MRGSIGRRAHIAKGGLSALAWLILATTIASAQDGAPTAHVGFAGPDSAIGAEASTLGDSRRVRDALRRLYDAEPGRLLWSVGSRPTSQAVDAITMLDSAHSKGLRPSDYDAAGMRARLAALTARSASLASVDAFDVALSRSVLRLLDHLHTGRVDPRSVDFELPESHAELDLAALAIAVSRSSDVAATVASAEPPYAGYARLTQMLARYRRVAEDPELRLLARLGKTLRPGDRYPEAQLLRRMLIAFGDLPNDAPPVLDSTGTEVYEGRIVDAVRAFQRRHGLEPDGAIGPATMTQLRIPAAQRVRQIELTLERWRWLPDRPPSRYIVVNVPAYRLALFEDDPTAQRPVLAMNVIVGQAHGRHHTPVFTNIMREVVFRPYWDVPLNIARKELVPIIRRNPDYLATEALEIVRGGDVGATIYPATPANLDRVVAGTLRLRQRPGPGNALGLVKFVFPNRYNVYMHGTPVQELFARSRRDFSHGCIRVEDPTALAEAVFRGQAEWDRTAIEGAMSGTRTRRIPLARPVTVYVLYATAVVDEAGAASFLPDLYGRDADLARALRLTPVAAAVR